jgi:hypothetical protein
MLTGIRKALSVKKIRCYVQYSFVRLLGTVLLIVVPGSASRACGQDTPTLSVNANVVSLFATVRDHHGRLVSNLNADDFVLEEDGIPQKIRYFSREANLPLTVGLLVDTSRSQRDVLDQEAAASSQFLDQVLRQGKDQAFVVHFDERVETLQGLTSSPSQLASTLAQLTIPADVATLLFSAVQQSSVTLMGKVSIRTAIEAAQRADTILYSIRFSDPIAAYRPIRAAILGAAKEHGKSDLQRMAEETGGVSYGVSKNQTLAAIYASIEDSLRNQYSIGYTPSGGTPDGKYHKIKLTTKDPHLIVDTRDGYYARQD